MADFRHLEQATVTEGKNPKTKQKIKEGCDVFG